MENRFDGAIIRIQCYKMLNQQHTEVDKKNETDLLLFMEES